MMLKPFIGYRLAAPRAGGLTADVAEVELTGAFCDYVTGGDGVYVAAERRGLRVCIPVITANDVRVKGLPPIEPSIRFDYSRVPASAVRRMLERCAEEATAEGGREMLFHLWFDECVREWRVVEPVQEQTRTSVRPLNDSADSSYARAMIELHSHGRLSTFFSETDDRDERGGFRLYGVVGDFCNDSKRPAMLLRVGVYGHFYLFPAEWIFELPEGCVRDLTGEEWTAAERAEAVRQVTTAR